MKKISKIILASVLAIAGTVGLVSPSFAKAGTNAMDCSDTLKQQIGVTAYEAVCGEETETEDGISNAIANIVTNIIAITGIIAVIFVVIGSVTYITAAGDPSKIKKGRDTIIYALIGLILAGLAFVITNAVIGAVNESESSETSSTKD